jgi:dTDP-4-amino-4,6-dideoxygalactose transaminase
LTVPIPLFDTATPLAPLRQAIQARVAEVIDRGVYILGPEVEAFERELAAYLGARHVIGVANGTDAITIALRALGIGPGDAVVVPSFTFYATAEAVVTAGATPVFCDVDPGTRNVTVETVRATQAAGATLDGAHAAALGDVSTLSFYPSKNLGCLGDGGAVITDDDAIAERVRSLRFHGSRDKRTFELVGYNSRLDELQAAVLRVLLPELDAWSASRRAAADAYKRAGLGDLVGVPAVPEHALAAWHLFVVTHPRADELIAELAKQGVQARGYYRTPLHRQPAMASYAAAAGRLEATEELAATNVALPMSPALTADLAREVVAAIAGVALS